MFQSEALNRVPGTVRIVAAALLGAAGAAAMTAAALGSFEFGILAAIGGGVATAIAAAIQVERSESGI
jgi:hypothetical protein